MLETAVGGVDYWAINTDAQALGRSKVLGAKVLNIGSSVTRGLGAGGDPNVGRLAAEESAPDIEAMVQGTDLCFITSGMGGGTGSGAVSRTETLKYYYEGTYSVRASAHRTSCACIL
jgi:cell division protein FtsZ